MMMKMVVCSWSRASTVYRDTLSTLLRGGIEAAEIELHTPQVAEYRAALPAEISVVSAPIGLHNAQNAALDLFPVGTRIVFADDDLRSIDVLSRGRLESVVDLREMFEEMFAASTAVGGTLWGTYPVHNAYFMRPVIRHGLWFCIGHLFGVTVTPDRLYGSDAAAKKGDYERTLLHFTRDGVVTRRDDISARAAPMRTAAGGNATPARASEERAAVRNLMRRWPGLVHMKPDRRGYPEISLRLPRAS
jgi:hypothetical protein